MSDDIQIKIPLNWELISIKESINKYPLTGKKLNQKEYEKEGLFPVIDQGQSYIGGYSNREDLIISSENPFIIFGDHTLKIKFINFDFIAGADGVKVFQAKKFFYPKLFYYFSQVVKFPHKGYARHFQFFEKAEIPLPPLAEQHRIVEKIEEEFTRLDAGVKALKRAKALIPKYRQSVLKAAMCGDLTKEWRALHPDVESAEVLVENVTSKNEDYKYIDPDFPKNWILAPFSAMSERVTVGHVGSMKNEYTNDGIPFLRGQNVRANRYDPKGLKYISRDFHNKLKKSSLQPGDLVVVRSGDVGVSCVIPDYLKEANCSDLIIVKKPKGILAEFAAYFMNSAAKKQINSKKVGVALTHFNTKSMAKTMIPVPPLEEQHEIVSEIERRFSIIDEMERVVDESLIKAERLRQSVLKKAFEGRLVEQSPDDEPAGVLLERIRAEKEMQAAEGKANGKKRKK